MKDIQSMIKSDKDYTARLTDTNNVVCLRMFRKDSQTPEFELNYYFQKDYDLDEMVCERAVYRFNCSKCAEKHFAEILKVDNWKEVKPGLFYSKRRQYRIMKVEDIKDAEVCKVITFVRGNWKKSQYKEMTYHVKRKKATK